MTRRFYSVISLVLVAAACATKPTPIPLSSNSESLNALVGNWSGEYSSEATGRSGSIIFKLSAGKDTAFGDVVMVPRAASQMQGSSDRAQAVTVQPSSEVLTVRFARLEGGAVSGVMNPYTDPACGCTVNTTFVGWLTDPNTIEGTFATTGSGTLVQQAGRWKVKRQ
jgi:hypothetical protein